MSTPTPTAPSAQELQALARSCPRSLGGWSGRPLPDTVRDLLEEAERGGTADAYGEDGVVPEVEEQVRALLGAPAAVLCPSGTLAQQVALRLGCRTSPRVALHATAHPVLHEDDAWPVVQGLVPVVAGERTTLDAVRAAHAAGPLGGVLVELPQRETGGDLHALAELEELSAWCRAEGVHLHLDGARLWECGPAYAPVPLAQVVALFDTAYVSLYKGLGAPSGAVLLGPADLVAQARTWRHRLGGTAYQAWPVALAARRGLRERLPRVPAWVAHAQALARDVEGVGLQVRVPPVTPLLHVVGQGAVERAQGALADVSRASGVWLGRAAAGPAPGTWRVEVSVAEHSLLVPPAEGAALLAEAARTAG